MRLYLEDEMSTEEYTQLFKQIARTESGSEQHLEEIEQRLEHLKKGAALSYADLEIIANPQFWPFSKHWMWPDKNQIEKKLETTASFFRDLPKKEINIIRRLNCIFKNIALVSIILRFARPDNYAIYSRPVLQILRVERGKNDVEEYMNYIREMRILNESFGLKKVSEVDQIIWAIFHLEEKNADELTEILANLLPENLTAKQLMVFLSANPLRVAREYLKRGDFMTAGFWAAKDFEKFLDDECCYQGIYVPDEAHKRSKMIKKLCEETLFWGNSTNRQLLYDTKKIRNKIVPGVKPFTDEDVERFIVYINHLRTIAASRG
jgi:hypothetical protein